jgi:hypothetical protein
VWVIVAVAVEVGLGFGVFVGVSVGGGVGNGPLPTYTKIWAGTPACPFTSRMRAVTNVVPSGNDSIPLTAKQNCTTLSGEAKR